MKTLNFKLIILLFLTISTSVIAQEKYDRKFHQTFDVNKETIFDISNKFGNITIENTNGNQITIDAIIMVEARTKEKAESIMDDITVTISKTGNKVTAETSFGTSKISNNNSKFEINYTIQMPAYLNTNLKNKYGNVTINELHGKNTINVDYGSLNVNRILDNNEKPLTSIDLGYCDNSRINEFYWGSIVIKYSDLKIESGKALAISSKYSELNLGKISSVVSEAAYDNYKIGDINNLVITAKYTDIEINEITKKLMVDNQYGDITVKKVLDGFEDIDITTKYSDVNLGISPNASYTLEAKTSYADIKYGDLNITYRDKDSFTQHIKGTSGKTPENAKIKVVSDYGDINLKP